MWSDVERGGNKKNNLFEGNFWETCSLWRKKWRLSICIIHLKFWLISFISLFQNGKSFSIKALNIERELDVHTGHEGSIVQYFTRSKLEKREIFVKGRNLPVPVRRFWIGSTTAAVFQKITENASFFLRKISIRVTIYLVDILILSCMIQETYIGQGADQGAELRQNSSHIYSTKLSRNLEFQNFCSSESIL